MAQLTTQQHRAIAALLSSRNVAEAAHQARVGERTMYRWMKDPPFRAALLEAEGEAIDVATRRLLGAQEKAIDTVVAMLDDPCVPKWLQLQAAQMLITNLLKLRELRNIEERLTALEARANAQSQ